MDSPNLITLNKISETKIIVLAYNGVKIGEFLMKEDGYFDYWPEKRDGYIPSYMLRTLADELDKLNENWDKSIQAAKL